MNIQKPNYRSVMAESKNFIGQQFNLSYKEDIKEYDIYNAINLDNIHEYFNYYQSLNEGENDDIKYLLAYMFLSYFNQNGETIFTKYWSTLRYKILDKDFHIHEYLVYYWAGLESDENKDNAFMISTLRDFFESRYLSSITYTFEPMTNAGLPYKAYKITCSEYASGVLCCLKIQNPKDDTWQEYNYEILQEKWLEIAAATKEIGLPITARHTVNKDDHNNHKLEIYNAKNDLFYLMNWQGNWTSVQIDAHNFILSGLIIETVDVNIEEKADELFNKKKKRKKGESMRQMEQINYNSAAWDAEFKFLSEVIETRYDLMLGLTTVHRSIYEIKMPPLAEYSTLGKLVKKFNFGFEERVILALAMAVHLRPQVLDHFFTRNEKIDRTFSQAGGLKGKFHSGYIPTLETATFVLAGVDISKRILIAQLFEEGAVFTKQNIIKLVVKEATEPKYAGQLVISNEYLEYLTTAKPFKPSHADNFPAEILTTQLEWEDLYLEDETIAEINNIETWLKNQDKIMYELKLRKHLKLGYRALFYGSSGTGKTLTATLLGKNLGLDVYRVDVSMITSKWIGETTQNLARLFDMAENKNLVLFFDEAESLFGKRATDVRNSTDSHYNQEVGYLLQRIENYDGLVILATNLLDNIDTAFMRRFQSLVYFPVPSATQQLALWKNIFANGLKLSKNVNLKILSEKYVLTASNITNVLRDATIKTLQSKNETINMQTLIEAIERELKKADLRGSVGFKR